MSKEIIRLFDHAIREINQLRHQNEILSAKVEVLDIIGRIAPLERRGMTMTEDITFLLQVQIDRMEKELSAK